MHRHRWARRRAAALALLLPVGAGAGGAQEADLVSLQADPARWLMPNGNYAAWNYSPLDQIDLDNVGGLTVAWTLPSMLNLQSAVAGTRSTGRHRST